MSYEHRKTSSGWLCEADDVQSTKFANFCGRGLVAWEKITDKIVES